MVPFLGTFRGSIYKYIYIYINMIKYVYHIDISIENLQVTIFISRQITIVPNAEYRTFSGGFP